MLLKNQEARRLPMTHSIEHNSQVPREQWPRFFDEFARDNEGRLVQLESFGGPLGEEPIGRSLPLLSINYDPRGKGDVVLISTGKKEVEYEHAIDSPQEIWVEQDQEGRGKALEIIGTNGDHTVVAIQ
jgi:hypothetical protein